MNTATTATAAIDRLVVVVRGRPAPQGSKRFGAAGQMREASPHLAAWRAAVVQAAYQQMLALGVTPNARPCFVGPVAVRVWFRVPGRADTPPDLDKLLRSTWDALTAARVWEDDARVVYVEAGKLTAKPELMGARIVIERSYAHEEFAEEKDEFRS